jgi:hypothetical protein
MVRPPNQPESEFYYSYSLAQMVNNYSQVVRSFPPKVHWFSLLLSGEVVLKLKVLARSSSPVMFS